MSYKKLVQHQLSFFVKLIALALVLFAAHYYIIISFYNDAIRTLPLWLIYTVNFTLVYAMFSIINYKVSKGSSDVFNVFMLGTMIKMVLIIVFLLPVILSDQENKIMDVLNFFIPYFIFLGVEVYFVSSFLSKK